MSNGWYCQKHHYTFAEFEASCPYCIAEIAIMSEPRRDPRCNCRIGTVVSGVQLMSHDINCPALVPEVTLRARSERAAEQEEIDAYHRVATTIPDCTPALMKAFEQRPTIMGIPVQLDDTMPVDAVKLQQGEELRIHPVSEKEEERIKWEKALWAWLYLYKPVLSDEALRAMQDMIGECDCHLHYHQVCDICQKVTHASKD